MSGSSVLYSSIRKQEMGLKGLPCAHLLSATSIYSRLGSSPSSTYSASDQFGKHRWVVIWAARKRDHPNRLSSQALTPGRIVAGFPLSVHAAPRSLSSSATSSLARLPLRLLQLSSLTIEVRSADPRQACDLSLLLRGYFSLVGMR